MLATRAAMIAKPSKPVAIGSTVFTAAFAGAVATAGDAAATTGATVSATFALCKISGILLLSTGAGVAGIRKYKPVFRSSGLFTSAPPPRKVLYPMPVEFPNGSRRSDLGVTQHFQVNEPLVALGLERATRAAEQPRIRLREKGKLEPMISDARRSLRAVSVGLFAEVRELMDNKCLFAAQSSMFDKPGRPSIRTPSCPTSCRLRTSLVVSHMHIPRRG